MRGMEFTPMEVAPFVRWLVRRGEDPQALARPALWARYREYLREDRDVRVLPRPVSTAPHCPQRSDRAR